MRKLMLVLVMLLGGCGEVDEQTTINNIDSKHESVECNEGDSNLMLDALMNTKMLNNIEYYAVEGFNFKLNFESLVKVNPILFNWDVSTNYGSHNNFSYEVLPKNDGDIDINISIRSPFSESIIDNNSYKINVSNGVTSNIDVMFVGDSTTNHGFYTNELINITDKVTLIGTRGQGLNKHEGRSGWTVSKYINDEESPFVFDGVLDVTRYLSETANYSDLVIFNLGINDIFSSKSETDYINRESVFINGLKEFQRQFESNGIEFAVAITIQANDQTSFGVDYGARYKKWLYDSNLHRLNQAVIDNFDNVIALNVSEWKDSVHPTEAGYKDIAHSFYYYLANKY